MWSMIRLPCRLLHMAKILRRRGKSLPHAGLRLAEEKQVNRNGPEDARVKGYWYEAMHKQVQQLQTFASATICRKYATDR